MKSIFSTVALVAVLAVSFSSHAKDLRDMKESQLTTQQKKEAFGKMTQEEIELLDNYESTKTYVSVINNQKPKDLSFNEKLKIVRDEQKK